MKPSYKLIGFGWDEAPTGGVEGSSSGLEFSSVPSSILPPELGAERNLFDWPKMRRSLPISKLLALGSPEEVMRVFGPVSAECDEVVVVDDIAPDSCEVSRRFFRLRVSQAIAALVGAISNSKTLPVKQATVVP